MAKYRWTQPGYAYERYFEAGEIANLPDDFVPPAAAEPLDEPAIAAYHRAGVQFAPPAQQRWTFMPVNEHRRIFWRQVGRPFDRTFVLNGHEHLGVVHQVNRGTLP
jgi:hypothetical protein